MGILAFRQVHRRGSEADRGAAPLGDQRHDRNIIGAGPAGEEEQHTLPVKRHRRMLVAATDIVDRALHLLPRAPDRGRVQLERRILDLGGEPHFRNGGAGWNGGGRTLAANDRDYEPPVTAA